MTPLPGRSNVLPEAEAGVGDEKELVAGVDRREGQAAPSQPRDSRPPRQGHTKTAEQIAEELRAQSWRRSTSPAEGNSMRRLARILRFGSDTLDIR